MKLIFGKEYTLEELNAIFLEFEKDTIQKTTDQLGAYYRNKRKLTKRIKQQQRREFFNTVLQDINDHIAGVRESLYKNPVLKSLYAEWYFILTI